MREIKYRGLNEETGEWVYGWYTKLVEVIRRFDAIIADVDGELTRFYIHNKETVGQYTGLHDKKNHEIYHGDICKIKFDVEKVEDYVFATLSKKEIESGERIFLVESPLFNNQPELNCDDIEVIGNIHENPELLEGRE